MLRRLFSLIILLLLLAPLSAQVRRVQNRPFIDERRFHYGFLVGLHDQSIRLENNGYIDPVTGAQWLAEQDRMGLGFSVGVLGEWKLNNTFALRLAPSLHFGSKHITFRNTANAESEMQEMKSSYLALPLDIKVTAPRFNNYRPYVIGGINPMYDLTTGKQTKLRATPLALQLELGLGCDLYLPFFKLNPELKFCLGLGNILKSNRSDLLNEADHIYTQSVNSMSLNMVVLTFYFE